MGAGKTKQTISHLKSYLEDKFQQTIEVYVPRHDLADEWEQSLEGINAKVIHVYPRTGGKWDEEQNSYPNPLCASGLITSGTWSKRATASMAMPV